jgi:phosphatidylinositol glycan class M
MKLSNFQIKEAWVISHGLALAVLLRALLLTWGFIQDQYFLVPYTDIDYSVFWDAARAVSSGYSPYQRATYRYTPLVAWILAPFAALGTRAQPLGKVIWCLADIACGNIALDLGKFNLGQGRRWTVNHTLRWVTWGWWLNPFVANMSTRGSAESLICLTTLAVPWLLQKNKVILSSIVFGAAVHLKLYPIIYALPIALYLLFPAPFPSMARKAEQTTRNSSVATNKTKLTSQDVLHLSVNNAEGASQVEHDIFDKARRVVYQCSFRSAIRFGIGSIFSFCILSTLMYTIYGFEFIENTYLYHLKRSDHRHNFSIYHFLLLSNVLQSGPVLFPFFSQALVTGILGAAFYKRLPLAMMLQTVAFVAWNKVITSQYFMWWLCWLPIASRWIQISPRRAIFLGLIWVSSQVSWVPL